MMDLVIQGPVIGAAELSSIAALSGAQGITVLDSDGHQAYRLPRVGTRAGVAEFCAMAGIDAAFVPSGLARDRVRLVAMDMDSTLITIECIDEIADMLGIRPQVATITTAAMRGDIDFRESLTRRVALLAGLPVEALAVVYDERVELAPGALRMLAGFKAVGARTLLVSGGFTFFTDRLQQRLGLDATASNTLEIAAGRLTGRLTGPIVDAQGKAARFAETKRELCAGGGIAVAVGDGANDVPMLRAADVSVAYRARPVARAAAAHAINYCGLDAVLNLFA
jgi:phosphoserine phosphatase